MQFSKRKETTRRQIQQYFIRYDDPDQSNFVCQRISTSFIWDYFKKDRNGQKRLLCVPCNLVMAIGPEDIKQIMHHLNIVHGRGALSNPVPTRMPSNFQMKAENTKSGMFTQKTPISFHKFGQIYDSCDDNSHKQENFPTFSNKDLLKQDNKGQILFYRDKIQNSMMFRPSEEVKRGRPSGPVKPKKENKIRGPRGPYKKKSQQFRTLPYSGRNEFIPGFNLKQRFSQSNEHLGLQKPIFPLIQQPMVQKVARQKRTEIKKFIRSLPYYFNFTQVLQTLIKQYQLSPMEYHDMIKKYHWTTTIDDKRCINQLRHLYRSDVIVRFKRVPTKNPDTKVDSDDESQSHSNHQNYQMQPQRNIQSDIRDQLINQNPDWDQQPEENLDQTNIKPADFIENNEERFIFLCTTKMKINYGKYGQVVRLVKFNNFIHSRSPLTVIIYIIGHDSSAKLMIFGVLILKEESYENFREGFEYFLSLMGTRAPKVIIRERNSICKDTVIRAISDIGKLIGRNIRVISHYNANSILKIIRKVEKNTPKVNLATLKNLIFSVLNDVFGTNRQRNLGLLKNALNQNFSKQSQIDQIMKDFEELILTAQLVQPSQVGFNLQIQRLLRIPELLQPNILGRQCLSKFIAFFFDLERRIEIQHQPWMEVMGKPYKMNFYEKLFKTNGINQQVLYRYEGIYELRSRLSPFIYFKLFSTFLTAVQQTKIKESTTPYVLQVISNRPQFLTRTYKVSQNQISKNWECECQLQCLTGLPCLHLLQVLVSFRQNIQQYVDSFWKLPKHNGNWSSEEFNNEEDIKILKEVAHECLDIEKGRVKCENDMSQLFWSLSH